MDMTLLIDGLGFLEAPRVDIDGTLYFSDIHLGGFFRYSPDGRLEHFVKDREAIGGLAINDDGRIVASGRNGLILVNCQSGEVETLCDNVGGHPIGLVNDVQPDGQGGLYAACLKPRADRVGIEALDRSPLLLVTPDRQAQIVADGIDVGNGIGLSSDGSVLYLADTAVGILAFDRSPSGKLTGQRVAVEHLGADGLAVDAEDCVWIASVHESAIIRFLPNGREHTRIKIPGEYAASLVFSGLDLKDLYVVTGSPILNVPFELCGSVLKMRSPVAGQATPLTRF